MAQQESSPKQPTDTQQLSTISPRPGNGERVRVRGEIKSKFTPEQRWWLEKMAEHIASNLGIEPEDFSYAPFNQHGGLGKVHQLFGAELPKVIATLNKELAA